MGMIQLDPPVEYPIALDAVKANLGVNGTAHDALLLGAIGGLVELAEYLTSKKIMPQTWQLTLDGFANEIALPHPVLGVDEIVYLDQAGLEQVLPLSATRLRVISKHETLLVPGRGMSWPATYSGCDVVTIRVRCGYANAAAVPDAITLWLQGKLAEEFNNVKAADKSQFLDCLLDPVSRSPC